MHIAQVGISVEPEVLLEPTLPSHGSVGHPHICRRPCVYFRTLASRRQVFEPKNPNWRLVPQLSPICDS